MNYTLQVISLFITLLPIVSELKKPDESISLIFSPSSSVKQSIPLNDILTHQISLPINDTKTPIKYYIAKNSNVIGTGEFLPYNDTKWLNISSTKKKSDIISSLFDTMKLKLKCTNELLSSSSSKKYQTTSSVSTTKTKKKKKSIPSNVTKQKSFGFSIRSAKPSEQSVTKYIFEKRIKGRGMLNTAIKLKHNKSCEDGIWGSNSVKKDIFDETNNIMYNSAIVDKKRKDSDISKSIKASNGKKRGAAHSSNTLTEVISRTNKKSSIVNSHSMDSVDSPSIIKKLDEKFQTIEEKIIDKNFEENIDNDEMIVSSKKKFFSLSNSTNLNDSNIAKNKTASSTNIDNKKVSSFSNDEYLDSDDPDVDAIVSKYDDLKTDFEIFYTKEYIDSITDDMLQLELQLELEKIFELQMTYHNAKASLSDQYAKTKKSFLSYANKYILLNKKSMKLQKERERAQLNNSICTFVNNHKIKNDKEASTINKDECKLWRYIIDICDKKSNTERETLIRIFTQIISKQNLSCLDNVEKLLCERLMKKYYQPPIPIKKQTKTKRSGSSEKNVYTVDKSNKMMIHSTLKKNRHSNNEIKSKKY